VGSDMQVHRVSFGCNADIDAIRSSFAIGLGAVAGADVTILRNGHNVSPYVFTIAYSGVAVRGHNQYDATVLHADGGVLVAVSTLQEGGYLNSHYNTTYTVLQEVQSVWVNRHTTCSSTYHIRTIRTGPVSPAT
jgi:hypothetical protein